MKYSVQYKKDKKFEPCSVHTSAKIFQGERKIHLKFVSSGISRGGRDRAAIDMDSRLAKVTTKVFQ